MKKKSILTIFLFTLFYSLLSFSQIIDSSLLTLDRIYNSSEFTLDRFGPARWLSDGSGYTTLERSKELNNGRDIVKYFPESGKSEILVPASKLIPPGESSPLRIENYIWSDDGKKLIIFTNSQRVWRQNTRGDYYLVDLSSWKISKLGAGFIPSSLMFAKFSPDGEKVGYVYKNNIYIENNADKKITQLTFDGSRTIINGTFDWVYEEEFDLRDGFRWSPDSKSIAFWQLDAEGVQDFFMINNTDSIYSRIIPVQYPKVGTTLSSCKVGIINIQNSEIKWIKLSGDPRNNYIARMDWAGNSEEIIIQYLNRLQNKNEVMLADRNTGKIKTVFVDSDEAWVNVVDDLVWLKDGKNFTFVSERDGWKHVYKISKSGDKVESITPGDYDVESIECLDEKGNWLYFIASPDNATQRYLYRIKMKLNSKPERLTPVSQPGTHSYQISSDAKWAFHTYSTIENPPVMELISLPDHKIKKTIYDNSTMKAKMISLKHVSTEFFKSDIGNGVILDGWMIKPYNFDSTKKYPVLFYVYGEPAAQTVLDRFGGQLWHLMLAQQGYIVISIDNRGTPAPRGREWRKCVYRKIGILAPADQNAAALSIFRKFNFIDTSRVGIWGWSGGGSMSLNAIFQYPNIYKTALAVAFVSNQLYYDAVYQERYMGLPKDNLEEYKNGSPITHANKLKGNLLIVHGTGDDNVHYQNAEALINKLVAENKHFTMMAYPNRSHGIYEGKNTTIHLYTLLTKYLKDNIPPGAR